MESVKLRSLKPSMSGVVLALEESTKLGAPELSTSNMNGLELAPSGPIADNIQPVASVERGKVRGAVVSIQRPDKPRILHGHVLGVSQLDDAIGVGRKVCECRLPAPVGANRDRGRRGADHLDVETTNKCVPSGTDRMVSQDQTSGWRLAAHSPPWLATARAVIAVAARRGKIVSGSCSPSGFDGLELAVPPDPLVRGAARPECRCGRS